MGIKLLFPLLTDAQGLGTWPFETQVDSADMVTAAVMANLQRLQDALLFASIGCGADYKCVIYVRPATRRRISDASDTNEGERYKGNQRHAQTWCHCCDTCTTTCWHNNRAYKLSVDKQLHRIQVCLVCPISTQKQTKTTQRQRKTAYLLLWRHGF